MAVRTIIVAAFDAGRCRCELDYNDATLAITKARVVNLSAKTCVIRVRHSVLLTASDLSVGPNTTQQRNLSGIAFTTNADGMTLGPFEVLCSWQ